MIPYWGATTANTNEEAADTAKLNDRTFINRETPNRNGRRTATLTVKR
jgi:hypothetical protein